MEHPSNPDASPHGVGNFACAEKFAVVGKPDFDALAALSTSYSGERRDDFDAAGGAPERPRATSIYNLVAL